LRTTSVAAATAQISKYTALASAKTGQNPSLVSFNSFAVKLL